MKVATEIHCECFELFFNGKVNDFVFNSVGNIVYVGQCQSASLSLLTQWGVRGITFL